MTLTMLDELSMNLQNWTLLAGKLTYIFRYSLPPGSSLADLFRPGWLLA